MTVDFETIREYVQNENYRVAGKTGEKYPPCVNGWNRKVELRKGRWMKEVFVDSDTYDRLMKQDWFPRGR